tara:strand:- start:48 stop:182 length:135 start_codon:yes stop_codon:yes gene_type:complete
MGGIFFESAAFGVTQLPLRRQRVYIIAAGIETEAAPAAVTIGSS